MVRAKVHRRGALEGPEGIGGEHWRGQKASEGPESIVGENGRGQTASEGSRGGADLLDAAGSPHNNVGGALLQRFFLLLDRDSSIECPNFDFGHVDCKPLKLLSNL
jgi:hypothetical protein